MCRYLFLLMILLAVTTGCRARDSLTPTPFPTIGQTTTLSVEGQVVLTVAELMAAPGLYRDSRVQLTGQLRKMPVIVCDSELYSSPASWGLGEEGLTAAAGGYDQQVRTLLPSDLTMTVEGRWRRWEGNVGCGKNAHKQEVWFIDVDRILSPSPLAQITLTPSSGVEISALTAEPSPAGIDSTVESEILETPVADQTLEPVEPTEFPEAYPGGTQLPSFDDQNITPTVSISQTPLAGQTFTSTVPIGTTITPTVGGSVTPGSTPTGTSTSTPPSSGSPGQWVDRGDLNQVLIDNFMTSKLDAGKGDKWEVEIFEGENLYFYAVAPLPADVILSVYKDGQALVNRQNTAPAGAPEFLNAPQLQGNGLYEIHIEVEGGVATEYGLTMYTDSETPVIIGGIITPGNPRSAVQLPVAGIHFWFFMVNAGDVAAIRLRPTNNLDAAADLYGPGAEYLSTIDSGYEGEEEYREITLDISGLHALRVYEYSSTEMMTYDLEIGLQ